MAPAHTRNIDPSAFSQIYHEDIYHIYHEAESSLKGSQNSEELQQEAFVTLRQNLAKPELCASCKSLGCWGRHWKALLVCQEDVCWDHNRSN